MTIEILAPNGVRLGKISWENDTFFFEPRGKMTLYMLEEALKHMKRRTR